MVELKQTTTTSVSEKDPTLQSVVTSCKDCCFAMYHADFENADEDPTQTDCVLGRIKAFHEQGPEGVVQQAYDDEKNFYIINGRTCNAHRASNSPWQKQHVGNEVSQVKREISISLDLVILTGPEEDQEAAYRRTAASILALTVAPRCVYFVCYDTLRSIKPGKLNALLHEVLGNQVTWRIVRYLGDIPKSHDALRGVMIDAAVARCEAPWYGVFQAGFSIPKTLIADVNEAVNERLERFCVLLPRTDGNGEVVQTAFHKHQFIMGNKSDMAEPNEAAEKQFPADFETCPPKCLLHNLTDKARFWALQNGQPHMVKSVEQVCPALFQNEVLHKEIGASA